MIVLKIENVKEFMSQLFAGDMFDRFHVNSCEVTTFAVFQVEGKLYPEWFDSDEKPGDKSGLVIWQQLKSMIFSIIKGKKTPGKMKIDFCHYMENGDCGSLRVQYENEELLLFTGYMQREFSMNKEKEMQWDESCLSFIEKNGIASTQLS